MNKTVASLRDDLAKRDRDIAEVRRMLFGKRGEKMPPTEREVDKRQHYGEVKNFLFVGNRVANENSAILQKNRCTCEAHAVAPQA